METDIGNPIDYNPNLSDEDNKVGEEQQQQYYFHPPEMNYPPPPPQIQTSGKVDFFANIEKSTWIIAFAVFLLGFFMGKTMQPVILRYT